MFDSISKCKLPKGKSFVLKTSQLDTALSEAGIDCHIDLVYWLPQSGGSILEAQYWLPNENIAYPRFYVRAGVVASELRLRASQALLEEVLPKFIGCGRSLIFLWIRHG
jgi:hypothetical protein